MSERPDWMCRRDFTCDGTCGGKGGEHCKEPEQNAALSPKEPTTEEEKEARERLR